MTQFSFTQMDSFLNFSDLHLLVFTSEWQLTGLYPSHRNFLDWNSTELGHFRFRYDFLDPNGMDLEEFLGLFQQRRYLIRPAFWRKPDDKISGPYESYFRLKKKNGSITGLMVFVRLALHPEMIEISPQEKQKIYLSDQLPGILHNMSNPLGTIIGNLEMLQSKNADSVVIVRLLKMANQIKEVVQNVGHKLASEMAVQSIDLNLDDVVQQQVRFFGTDSFFKNQVEKNLKVSSALPILRLPYGSVSGIIDEFYHFFRKMVNEDQIYVLQMETFSQNGSVGFFMNFLGDFIIPENLDLHFPVQLSGNDLQVAQHKVDGLDTLFLSHCLKFNHGTLEISCRKEMMTLRLNLPFSHDQSEKVGKGSRNTE